MFIPIYVFIHPSSLKGLIHMSNGLISADFIFKNYMVVVNQK